MTEVIVKSQAVRLYTNKEICSLGPGNFALDLKGNIYFTHVRDSDRDIVITRLNRDENGNPDTVWRNFTNEPEFRLVNKVIITAE